MRTRVKQIVGLDSLDNLARGGRIGKVGAFLGAMLNLKVTLTVDANGEFVPLERNRGEKAALRHTIDWVSAQMGSATSGKFAIGHALALERAQKLAEEIESRYTATELVIYETGSVICDAHRHRLGRCGPSGRVVDPLGRGRCGRYTEPATQRPFHRYEGNDDAGHRA